MATSYKIDKSKEAMSTKAWGEIDKEDLRNKIMEADNKAELVKACYMIVEDGWEDAPSQHLKYPVMCFEGDTLVYNRGALSAALAYAKQHDETAVVNKVEKIYKNLDLDDSEGKEEKKMSEIEFAAVNIGELWSKLYDKIHEKYPLGEYDSIYYIMDIYEEGGQKFAIIRKRDESDLYRLDFSFTEEGLTISEEIVKVEVAIVETDIIRKFAEPENVADYRFAEEDPKPTVEELLAKIAELQGCIDERDNIIMGKDEEIAKRDTELEELRRFKCDTEAKERAIAVEKIMSEVVKFMDKDTASKFREEGLSVEFAQLDAWSNKVKASVVDKVTKQDKGDGIFSFSAPIQVSQKSSSVWERIKNN